MTRCDHGIPLDRFCGDCESAFTFVDDYPRAMRRQSRTAAVLALLALVVFTGCYIVVKGAPR